MLFARGIIIGFRCLQTFIVLFGKYWHTFLNDFERPVVIIIFRRYFPGRLLRNLSCILLLGGVGGFLPYLIRDGVLKLQVAYALC